MRPARQFVVRWVIANHYHTFALSACVALIGAFAAFTSSFLSNTNLLLGCCLLPFSLFSTHTRKFNHTYLWLLLLFGIAAYHFGVRAFYFFMLGFYGLFLFELYFGKVNTLAIYLLAFSAPVFHQVSVILGFPIRLQLSEWAGAILSMAGTDITVNGNIMTLKGNAFSVDDACMGLSMLSISLLMGVAAIAHQYRVSALRLNFFHLFIFFSAVFVLNIASNLIRIVLLVLFYIRPEDLMHEIIGILCLLLYVVIPLHYLSKALIHRLGKADSNAPPTPLYIPTFHKIVLLTIMTMVVVTGMQINSLRTSSNEVAHVSVAFPGVMKQQMDQGITKIYNEDLLVYLKPIPEFFTGEHTPLLCWKGSGFEFNNVRKKRIAGNELYVGTLEKPGERLFTAWWYNNGKTSTLEQWDWRMRMLRGEDNFCLINVTAKDEIVLETEIELILKNNWLVIEHESTATK
jgi:exosortase N